VRVNHRFTLRREWLGEKRSIVNFIMLNPSTADDVFDDATIRRCIGFSKHWGFTGLVVTNLYAYRATDPMDLKALISKNPHLAIGEGNDATIAKEAATACMVVCAWGDKGDMLFHRDLDVISQLRAFDLKCIRRTAKGNPAHPVRERYTDHPAPFYDSTEGVHPEVSVGEKSKSLAISTAPCQSQPLSR
jgi:hypothetical protein